MKDANELFWTDLDSLNPRELLVIAEELQDKVLELSNLLTSIEQIKLTEDNQ
jgi:hypothetical protein